MTTLNKSIQARKHKALWYNDKERAGLARLAGFSACRNWAVHRSQDMVTGKIIPPNRCRSRCRDAVADMADIRRLDKPTRRKARDYLIDKLGIDFLEELKQAYKDGYDKELARVINYDHVNHARYWNTRKEERAGNYLTDNGF